MKNISRWYFNRIPSKDTQEFLKFLGNAHQLGKLINSESGISAYYGGTGRLPVVTTETKADIPGWVGHEALSKEEIVAFWNTMILRSAVMSTNQTKNYTKVLGSNVAYSVLADNLFAANELRKSAYSIFETATEQACYTEETFLKAEEQDNLYVLLEHFFNPALRGMVEEIFGHEVCEVMEDIEQQFNIINRAALTMTLKDLLEQEKNQEKQPAPSDSIETMQDIIEDELGLSEANISFKALHDMNLEISKVPDRLWTLEGDGSEEVRVKYLPKMVVEETTALPYTNKYVGFGRYLRYVATPTILPTIPHYQGQDLLEDCIENILIDGEVLGIPSKVTEFKPAHVIILCDYSRSTHNSQNLYIKELQAAKALYKDLRKIGHFVEVWGHTSTRNITILYQVVGINTGDVDRQFEKLLVQYSGANHDYAAIKYFVKKEFNKFPALRKFLWSLSDGQPIGDNAIGRTQEAANFARKQGITVTSISLVPLVVDANDIIYGKENNIDASQNLDEAMKRLAVSISRPEEKR